MAALTSSVSAGDVLALIASGTADTRASIGHATGLSRSTVAERLDALFHVGLIRESGEAQSSGGRPSKTLQLNSGAFVALAADIGENHVRLVVTDLREEVIAESVGELAVSDGPEVVLSWIASQATDLLGELGRHISDVLGIGLSVPAPVDFARGEVVGPSVMTGWDGVDIEAAFRQFLDVPVLVENDVNARGLGEYLLAWRDQAQFLYIKAGTGIGSAILTRGTLFRGAQGAAGDIGHIRLEPGSGVLCRCGAIGCVEALAAGWAIQRDLSETGLESSTTRETLELVRKGEPQAVHRVRESGRILGRAIAYCVSLLNPNIVVVGGSLADAGDHLMMGIRESVYQYSLPLATRELQIVAAQGDERCGVRGAAHLVIEDALLPDRVNELIRARLVSGDGVAA